MYYVMNCDSFEYNDGSAALSINNNFKLAGIRLWKTGKPIAAIKKENIPTPVEINFDAYKGYAGEPPSLEDVGIPLMSKKLANTLTSAGVDNLELFPAIVKNNQTGQTFEYQVYNVIGLVAAMDRQNSDYESYKNMNPVGGASIYELVLDESRIQDLLLFRLSENISTLVVHETIKNKIEEMGILDITFIKPENYIQI